MSIKIVLNNNNKECLEKMFINAPKTLKEALLKEKILPIPNGIKYNFYKTNYIKIELDLKKKKELILSSWLILDNHIFLYCNFY